MLGAAVERSFRDDLRVHQHSFPAPNVSSGCFVADIDLGLGHDWDPNREEMMTFSAQMHRLAEKKLPLERLTVDASLAQEMFSENPHKLSQIPSIAGSSGDGRSVTVYRVGDHVDMSAGPMIGDTSFLGRRCTIPVAHKIQHGDTKVYRQDNAIVLVQINKTCFLQVSRSCTAQRSLFESFCFWNIREESRQTQHGRITDN